ncbi:heavy-metal-associated domain-containing protein [Planococcus lenghuensis]|uniref:HMA domain-containing protein n=1 Tax=Planococcus lenghuensis TaxID=2213202 RepID=A0A1Q2L3D5_9BACL|nr:heavy-metal-associated domain-containing protein [Planococcus lenghuensis]AQQ54392.1 hypothetical protein B0X71_15650 [Planococcus lenghuensis]
MEVVTFNVRDVTGKKGIEKLEKVLIDAPGVERALVDMEKEQVTIEYNAQQVSLDQLVARVEEHGCEITQ